MNQMTYTPSREVEKILDGFRLLDDTFMTLFFDQNFEATTLLLNVILERSDIRVKRMELQKVEKNPDVDGRNVTLDIFAEDADGKNYDIEVQRADKGAARKRARFFSGVMDSRMLDAGDDFSKICDSYVIFITENDVLKRGMHHYKETEGGREYMCKAMEDYVEKKKMEDKIEIAKKMIADNLPIEKVSEYSGLSLDKIREIAGVKTA